MMGILGNLRDSQHTPHMCTNVSYNLVIDTSLLALLYLLWKLPKIEAHSLAGRCGPCVYTSSAVVAQT